jgi:tol-pal system protein YbgF
MRRPFGAAVSLLPLLAQLVACSANVEQQQLLEKMAKDLAAARAALDATNTRVDELSRQLFIVSDKVESVSVEQSRTQLTRKLKVIKLQPGQAASVSGAIVSSTPPVPAPAPARAQPTAAPAPAVVPARTQEERRPPAKELYDGALALFRAGKYDDAEVSFLKFLNFYPSHDYSDNAYYWIGESRFERKDLAGAVEAFVAVLEKYPEGNKVPDAMFKLGLTYVELGRAEEAKATLRELVATYPRSEPAQKARARLMQLDPSEG